MTDRFYAFQDFVLAYFHPDWRLDDPDAPAVVADFVRTTHFPRRAAVVQDIDGLLQLPLEEDALHDLVLRDYDLNYDPYSDGITMRDWLTRTRDAIAIGVADSP